jgi:hypothetical protein
MVLDWLFLGVLSVVVFFIFFIILFYLVIAAFLDSIDSKKVETTAKNKPRIDLKA